MKRFFISPIILLSIMCLGSMNFLAQTESQEIIIVKIIIKKKNFEHLLKVPVEKSFENSKLTGGGFATVDCSDCLLESSYEFYGFAENVNQNQTRVSVTTNFKNQKLCNFEDKIFIVSRNGTTNIKLKCGIKIVAYYENKNNEHLLNDN